MATIKPLYGTNNQAITCSLSNLPAANYRASTAVDNTTNLFLDALVFLKVKSGGAVGTNPTINVYAYGTADGGTTYTDGITGTDATFTPTNSGSNLKLIGTFSIPTNGTTYFGGPFSVAQAFGGILPDHWGIVVQNNSGSALDAGAEGTTFSKFYQGIQAQSV